MIHKQYTMYSVGPQKGAVRLKFKYIGFSLVFLLMPFTFCTQIYMQKLHLTTVLPEPVNLIVKKTDTLPTEIYCSFSKIPDGNLSGNNGQHTKVSSDGNLVVTSVGDTAWGSYGGYSVESRNSIKSNPFDFNGKNVTIDYSKYNLSFGINHFSKCHVLFGAHGQYANNDLENAYRLSFVIGGFYAFRQIGLVMHAQFDLSGGEYASEQVREEHRFFDPIKVIFTNDTSWNTTSDLSINISANTFSTPLYFNVSGGLGLGINNYFFHQDSWNHSNMLSLTAHLLIFKDFGSNRLSGGTCFFIPVNLMDYAQFYNTNQKIITSFTIQYSYLFKFPKTNPVKD